MKKTALLYKFKQLSLATGILVSIIVGSIIVSYQLSQVNSSVRNEGEFLASLVFENLYSLMEKGWNKSDIENKLNTINSAYEGIDFHLHRSPLVSDLYGERHITNSLTQIEQEMLHGQGDNTRIDYLSSEGFIYSKSIHFKSNCLVCHSNAKENDVAGILSVTYGFSQLRVSFIQSFFLNLFTLITTLLISYIVYTRSIKKSIIKPFNSFIKKLKKISQSEEIEYSHSSTPIIEIAEIENIILKEHSDLLAAFKMLEESAIKDELTGLYNRKKLIHEVTAEISRFERYNTPFSIISIDLNDFKPINDNYGHTIGDDALCHFSRTISSCTRNIDLCFRLGGDEFLILLPNTPNTAAIKVREKITHTLKLSPLPVKNGELFLNASMGVCEVQEEDNFESIMSRADEAMYEHKRYIKANRPDDFVI